MWVIVFVGMHTDMNWFDGAFGGGGGVGDFGDWYVVQTMA